MAILEFVLPEGSPDPCPYACGRLTEDAAGGPCKACWAELDEEEDEAEHCGNDCAGTCDESGALAWAPEQCVHCECCCNCLGCVYGPADGMLLTEEQRAGIDISDKEGGSSRA